MHNKALSGSERWQMGQSKKELVKARLVRAIAIGEYPPGTFLRQNAVAEAFGLSSTPVREAFTDLQASGLLVHANHRGFHVVELDERRVVSVYQARRIVEPAAARLAVDFVRDADVRGLHAELAELRRLRRTGELPAMIAANERLQRSLYALCGNAFLVEAIVRLWNSIPRYLPWVLDARQDASLAEHSTILDALAVRDAQRVESAVERHLQNAQAAFTAYLGTAAPRALAPVE